MVKNHPHQENITKAFSRAKKVLNWDQVLKDKAKSFNIPEYKYK